MSSAVQLARALPVTLARDPDDSYSVAELVARMSGSELLAAQKETSAAYNGKVLARAVVIVQCRIRCLSMLDLAKRMGIAKNTVYRWARGMPSSPPSFDRAIRELAFLLLEQA